MLLMAPVSWASSDEAWGGWALAQGRASTGTPPTPQPRPPPAQPGPRGAAGVHLSFACPQAMRSLPTVLPEAPLCQGHCSGNSREPCRVRLQLVLEAAKLGSEDLD